MAETVKRRTITRGAKQAVPTQASSMTEPAEKGLFQSRDGTNIYYEVRGKGRPLIFAYGLTCKMEHWRHQLNYFAGRYQLITLDYRGHHRSSMPTNERHLTLKWCAKDVQDLIRHLNLDEVVCLGHSMGVPVLTYLAGLEPKCIKGLVLICGTMGNPFKHMFHSDKLDRFYRVTSQLYNVAPQVVDRIWHFLTKRNPFSYLMISRLGFNAGLSESHDVKMYMDGVHESPLLTFQSLLHDYNSFEGQSLLKNIVAPTMVLAGESDLITPIKLSEKMAKAISNSEFTRIPDGSHNTHMDLPGVVNRKIEVFLSRIGYQ